MGLFSGITSFLGDAVSTIGDAIGSFFGRVELMRQARLDIIEAETKSRIAQEQARAQGFAAIAQAIITMQERLNDIAQKRIAIIEGASLQAVKEAEEFYGELDVKIRSDHEKYLREKLPTLLEMLGKYEAGTPAHEIYRKMVDEDAALQIKHTARQLESAAERQGKIIDGILYVKDRVAEQTGQITEAVNMKLEALSARMPELPNVPEVPALPQ